MNTLKMLKTVIVVLVLSVLTGCSEINDPVSSSGNTSVNNKPSEVNESVPNSGSAVSVFKTIIKLKPHRTYTFGLSNTGFSKFTGIDVENISVDPYADRPVLDCEDLLIYGSLKDDIYIGCHSKEFDFKEITIENLSSGKIELSVSLQGIKAKKKADWEY